VSRLIHNQHRPNALISPTCTQRHLRCTIHTTVCAPLYTKRLLEINTGSRFVQSKRLSVPAAAAAGQKTQAPQLHVPVQAIDGHNHSYQPGHRASYSLKLSNYRLDNLNASRILTVSVNYLKKKKICKIFCEKWKLKCKQYSSATAVLNIFIFIVVCRNFSMYQNLGRLPDKQAIDRGTRTWPTPRPGTAPGSNRLVITYNVPAKPVWSA